MIETERLVLRLISDKDVQLLTDCMNDPVIGRDITFVELPWTDEQSREWIEAGLAGAKKATDYYFSGFDKITQEYVGAANLHHIEKGAAEFGYWVHRNHRGAGYAKEMAVGVIRYGFEKGIELTWATVAVFNEPSQHIIRSLGFSKIKEVLVDTPQGERPSYLYHLKKSDFEG